MEKPNGKLDVKERPTFHQTFKDRPFKDSPMKGVNQNKIMRGGFDDSPSDDEFYNNSADGDMDEGHGG